MESRYDGIVIGTGHNSLVLQAYLARAGLSVLSVDRSSAVGGGLATVENPRLPGFLHNTHSFFHRGATEMPWFRDLELSRRGVRYEEPELNVAMLLADGRSLEWWRDPERTLDSVARFSPRDAAGLRRWIDEFTPIVRDLIDPEACSPPLPPDRRVELLRRSATGRRFLDVSSMSPIEFVRSEFENDVVRAGLLFFNGLREVDLRLPGFGHSVAALLASGRLAQMCVGGSLALARGLVEDIEKHGGRVESAVDVRRVVFRDGRAGGIELGDGRVIEADRFVVSGIDPRQTFLHLIDGKDLPEDLRRRAEGFRFNRVAPLFCVDVALAEPPRYRAADERKELESAFMTIIGLERFSQFEELVHAHDHGDWPPMVAWGACPTRFDSSQAPAGKHTAFLWQKVPFDIEGDSGNWREQTAVHGGRLLDFWRSYAPNLNDDVILDAAFRSPLDTVAQLPNMHRGDLLVGSFENGQVGYHRPFPGAGAYRTELAGLYLCGGSTHPGGNVTGLCGYNAASVICSDSGLAPWWGPRQVEEVWKML